MKITKTIKCVTLLSTVLLNTAAWAYSADQTELQCKPPHFREFSLPVYAAPENKEVPPESEFTIMMSPWTHPDTIKLTAKGKPLKFTMESNDSFHRLTAKLPAEFNGSYVRLNLSAKAILGCHNQEGWLLKVAKPLSVAPTPTSAPSLTETQPAPKPEGTAEPAPANAAPEAVVAPPAEASPAPAKPETQSPAITPPAPAQP